MACWGIGLTILETLVADERVHVTMVLTRNTKDDDPWAGVVMSRAQTLGIASTSFEAMGTEALCYTLDKCEADILMVHAYPKKLPREVFGRLPLGTINLHPSLLPLYRGPSPTDAVLQDKAQETGLTAHIMDDEFDSGPIISQRKIPVLRNDSIKAVIERMKSVVPSLMEETVTKILDKDFEAS